MFAAPLMALVLAMPATALPATAPSVAATRQFIECTGRVGRALLADGTTVIVQKGRWRARTTAQRIPVIKVDRVGIPCYVYAHEAGHAARLLWEFAAADNMQDAGVARNWRHADECLAERFAMELGYRRPHTKCTDHPMTKAIVRRMMQHA
jgi:hypothetical protein